MSANSLNIINGNVKKNLFNSIFNLETGYVNKDNLKNLTTKRFQELFNDEKMKIIVDNMGSILESIERNYNTKYDPLALINNYYKDSKNGITKVSYIQSDNGLYGRHQAKNAISGQGMLREARHTIFNEFYYDIDMVNCHPVIIRWLCRNLNMDVEKYKCLDSYINDRNAIFDELIELNPSKDKDFFKACFLSMNNGGHKAFKDIKRKSEFIKAYHKEIEDIRSTICDTFHEFKSITQNKLKDANSGDYNLYGKTMSHICNMVENQLLMIMCEYFKKKLKKDFKHSILCFDGIMILKKSVIDPKKILKDLKNEFKNLDIDIDLSIKSMSPLDLTAFEPKEILEIDDLKNQIKDADSDADADADVDVDVDADVIDDKEILN